MGKEISLGDLSASVVGTNRPNVPVVNSASKVKPISTNELGKFLEKEHPEEAAAKAKSKEEMTPELVEDAFASMNKTIQEKKDNADKMVEDLSRALEEKSLESDLDNISNGKESSIEADNTAKNTVRNSGDILDELANFNLDDEDISTEESKEENTNVVVPSSTVEESTVEENIKTVKEVKEEKPVQKINTENKPVEAKDDDIDSLLKEIDDEDPLTIVDTEAETPDEARSRLKKSLNEIHITKDPIDLSKFTISDKPVSASAVMNFSGGDNVKRADFPLYHSKKNVTHSPSTGVELDNLRKTIANSNGVNAVVASLRFIWKHIIDANKPDFEVWCKSIRTEDIESLYYGHYLACYNDANVVAVDCTNEKCNKSSIIDIPLDKFIKFETKDVEDEFNKLKSETTTSPEKTVINATLMQISDDYVLSIIDATLYTTFVQYASLKPEVTERYADILNGMAYVDKIFMIDRNDNTLRPVKITEYPNNINKTVLGKLKVYAQVLKTLSSDQYNILMGKLNNIISVPKITFVRPECKCPICGATIAEQPVQSMLNLLFTRAQLVQVKSF